LTGADDAHAVNKVNGDARDVVQARDVHGGVNLVQFGQPELPVPRQLPHDVRGLVGREEQLRWLDRMVRLGPDEESPPTISVISGMAGTGKSSLAVHWSHRVRTRFPDGQLYADLCGYAVEHPEFHTRVMDRFLRSLGIPDSRVPPDIQEKEGLYRSLLADRRVLIVLDNAATAAQVRPLLPGGSECVVVITSRNRLAGIEGAGYLTLEPLRHDDAVTLLREMLQGRADDDAELGELAVACAQLPLALCIAAQRAAHRPKTPLTDMLTALRDSSDRWRALSMENGNEAEAVHSVFAWSYYALPPGTARFFRLLGLHPGPDLRVEAAAALAGVTLEEARAAMEVLTDAHLVEQSCARRYRMHDLVNAYAKDRAEAQESAADIEAARRRVIEWYLQGSFNASQYMDLSWQHPLGIDVEHALVEAPPMPDRQTAAAWFEHEWLNIVAAVDIADCCGFLVLVWQMAATLRFTYLRADRRDAGLAVQGKALQAARQLADRWAEATILDCLSVAYTHFGLRDECREATDAAIEIWQQLGDSQGEAVTKIIRSIELIANRDWKIAVGYVEDIVAATRRASYRRIYGVNIGNLGECMLELGDLAKAQTMVAEALVIHREFDWDMGIADTSWNLSRIMRANNKMADALPHALEAVERAKHTSDANLLGRAMLELAVVLQANRKHDEAMAAYQEALDHTRLTGDRCCEARVLERVAVLHHERGNLRAAHGSHELSIDISREIGDRWFLAISLERCGETMARLDRYRDARAARSEALELFKEFDEPAARAAGDRLSAALGAG
jgi:tetratricopeptide (TPR) repeat protein